MRALITWWSPALTLVASTLLIGTLVSACANEPEEPQIPDVAEVEVEPAEVKERPGGVEIELPEIRLENAFPLTDEDEGDLVIATGTVVGKPGASGFFLRTESNKVLFVESTTIPVRTGDAVSIIGPLRKATVAIFEGWEKDAFENQLEAEWELTDLWYIEAVSVSRL